MWDTTRCHRASISARCEGSWYVCGLGLLDPEYEDRATLRIVGGGGGATPTPFFASISVVRTSTVADQK
jgi:hypothetical protein